MRRTKILCITSRIARIDLTMTPTIMIKMFLHIIKGYLKKSHLTMVTVRLSLTKCVELCSATKNSDDIMIKGGELIYLAAKSEKRLSFKVSKITTSGKQDFVEKIIHIIK